MITIYASEQRGGRIKMTTDKDCLPPDAIRVSEWRNAADWFAAQSNLTAVKEPKMTFTITNPNNGESHDVPAEQSCTAGLLITQEIGWQERGLKRPRWHVTHEGTSFKLTGSSLPKKHARLIAGAIGGLPIDWTMKTQEEVFRAVTSSLSDKALRNWLTHELRY